MKNLFLATIAFSSMLTQANEEGAFLDGKYTHLIHPKTSHSSLKTLTKNDVATVIGKQSAVKSQAARGTCSIFSATAYLEGLLITTKNAPKDINLSEEWLEYTSLRGKTSDGSTAPENFTAILNYGMPSELTLPYIGEDWTKAYNPLKETRCGHLKATAQTACYIVHRDPKLLTMTENQIITTLKDEDFIAAKKEAATFKATYLKPTSNNFYMYNTDEVKNTLAQGKAVILELDFYYAAWNHREAEDFGLTRNMDHWSKGIVSAPEIGSVDTEKSEANPAGHSILVVGFDDNKIVTKQVLMKDGTTKTFTYKGVYYFKNSWGTSSFGANFEVDGKKFPGYGMITYKYAEEKGAFFKLEI